MKRKIILGIIGFTILTAFLCNDRGNVYQKQKNFKNVDEVLDTLESNQVTMVSNRYYRVVTDEISECLSKRKRVAGDGREYKLSNFEKISIDEIIDLSEKEKSEILDAYNSYRQNYNGKLEVSNVTPIKIKVTGTLNLGGNIVSEKSIITMVLVDEGEGFVIDYITSKSLENEAESIKEDRSVVIG